MTRTSESLIERYTAFTDPEQESSALLLGMKLFLASLTMLFAATVIGYVTLRVTLDRWPDLPALPTILWLSTALLIISSGTIQLAVSGIQRGKKRLLSFCMLLTVALGGGFLLLQTLAWYQWAGQAGDMLYNSDTYRFALTSFFVLTALHAAHVVGGLIPMIIVTLRTFRGWYTPQRHRGVRLCAIYWHFLDAVWLVLFALLLLGT